MLSAFAVYNAGKRIKDRETKKLQSQAMCLYPKVTSLLDRVHSGIWMSDREALEESLGGVQEDRLVFL